MARTAAVAVALSTMMGALALILATSPAQLHAQDSGVAIEPLQLPLADGAVLAKAKALKDGGKLLSREQVQAGMMSPKPETLKLLPVSTRAMKPREIASRARRALVRVGWFFLCPRCNHWHLKVAGGYAITADGAVTTCRHCIAGEDVQMREGYLLALDANDDVLPVSAVLAQDPVMDVAILRVAGGKLAPLALNDRVAPGDTAYLYSDPMGVAGYFSAGMVNRFFWRTPGRHASPTTLAGARDFRMHVSTDWAPGSSGAPVLDACGNVVGHVAVISSFQRNTAPPEPVKGKPAPTDPNNAKDDGHAQAPVAPPSGGGATMMTLHEAVPARAVRLLAESLAARVKETK